MWDLLVGLFSPFPPKSQSQSPSLCLSRTKRVDPGWQMADDAWGGVQAVVDNDSELELEGQRIEIWPGAGKTSAAGLRVWISQRHAARTTASRSARPWRSSCGSKASSRRAGPAVGAPGGFFVGGWSPWRQRRILRLPCSRVGVQDSTGRSVGELCLGAAQASSGRAQLPSSDRVRHKRTLSGRGTSELRPGAAGKLRPGANGGQTANHRMNSTRGLSTHP
jgi:hypothetical protein